MGKKIISFIAAIGLIFTILISVVANVNHGHGPGHHGEHGEESHEHSEGEHEEESHESEGHG